ncbi:molybdate ABC transporter substrate-binding protein [Actinoplanes friuliensis]|uniref:Molybdenum ABC transporter periplasmic substrate-binding protein n=1 Tax=Actinoplanes friuliensis DSM 7358 TaxID=1246995 RepID=U5WAE4_9ACTN|nr:molybdate ABC transporter substrate-binding protein [Actinoplanes friuliensis]AGZ44916.1 molybdenum ABC transporter periplasmic substrate-binding protein [Actinoplanes friuliensis DSM 7358]
MKARLLAAVALAAALSMTGCGGSALNDDSPAGGGSSASGPAGSSAAGPITVLAAASLTESFDRIGTLFEQINPNLDITVSYGGSSGLATQITSGAPADVFAAASPATMATVTDAGDTTGTPATFARNQLVIAVPKGNPKGLTSLGKLAGSGIKVALCAEQVPCGAAAKKALDAAGVKLTPVTQDQDVKAALAKLKLGEVDAALVYRTDARSATADVDGVEFPESAEATNDYPIVALKDAPNPAGAAAFVAFVQTPEAQQVLTDAGFQKP